MMGDFLVYPAIDLRRGQVVRLQEGDPTRQTYYSSKPADTARRWTTSGARWVHVVNLDGAFGENSSPNRAALAEILAAAAETRTLVQFGGGLRSMASLSEIFEMGVTRAVLGTAVIEQPGFLLSAIERWGPERIAAGLDARGGFIQVRGWKQDSGRAVTEVGQELASLGLRWLVFTDIARDGLQTGLNASATAELAALTGLSVIASGGVSGWDDIRSVCQLGLPGVIVGKALYENRFDPEELFAYRCG